MGVLRGYRAAACTVCECEGACVLVFTVQGATAQPCRDQNPALVSSSPQSSKCVRPASLSQTVTPWRLKGEGLVLSWSVMRRPRSVSDPQCLTEMSGSDSWHTLLLPLSWILRGKQTLQDSTDFIVASRRLPVTEWNNEEAERKECCGLSNHISVTPLIWSHFSSLQPSRQATLEKQQGTKVDI